MKQKELILLMAALTKGGKTTIARAMSKKTFRKVMSQLCNFRTEVSVDWTYDINASSINLVEVLLNYKGIFGSEIRENFKSEKFNEILDSEDGTYLRKILNLEKQPERSPEELEYYIEDKIKDYINSSTIESLSNLIKNRKSNKFIRRIKVVVPPEENFAEYLIKKDITLVLRDTRGLLDMDAEEAVHIKNWTMQELGIDGINAVLLMGTSASFPDALKWYTKAYKDAFESVPVFIMARQDTVSFMFDLRYGIDEDNINTANIKEFLEAVKRGQEKGYKDIVNSFIPCYQLLEMFEMGHFCGNEFEYEYKVYNNEDLRYVYPNSPTLQQCTNSEPDYDALDYKLYEMIVHENLKDMISKMIEHDHFRKAVFENEQINSDFISVVTKEMHVLMYPDYRNYSVDEVCRDILIGENILGPRDGITTTQHGKIKYLGAITSAVSSRVWLRGKADAYEFKGSLKNPDGTDLIKDMPEKCQRNLIRMFILKTIEDNTDHQAYFQGYYFINRYKVQDSIKAVREKLENKQYTDALTETTFEILKRIF